MLPERICAKIEITSFCWLWTCSSKLTGYRQCSYQGKLYGAHRLVYTLLVGTIPKGYEIDHLCRVTRCVNPDHLEPVTRRENLRRQALWKGWNFREEGEARPKSARRIQEESGLCRVGHDLKEVGVHIFEGSRGTKSFCKVCYGKRTCNWYHRSEGCPSKCLLQTYPRQC